MNLKSGDTMTRRARLLLMAALGLITTLPAWGHGVELFATVEGTAIHGMLKYPDGTPIADAPVLAYGPDNVVLGETRTDATGRFELPVRQRCDYRLVGDAGEGHLGAYTVKAEELPLSLGKLDGGAEAAPADLDTRIEMAVARQIGPLREQLFGYEKQVRLRDMVGGVGYVFGVAGVIVLLKHRKSRPGG